MGGESQSSTPQSPSLGKPKTPKLKTRRTSKDHTDAQLTTNEVFQHLPAISIDPSLRFDELSSFSEAGILEFDNTCLFDLDEVAPLGSSGMTQFNSDPDFTSGLDDLTLSPKPNFTDIG